MSAPGRSSGIVIRSFYSKSFRLALVFGLIFSIAEVAVGDLHGKEVAVTQPIKVAALESFWETEKAAPFTILVIPDEANERNSVELFQIPKFMSWLLYGDANSVVKGLKEWPKEERPPVALTYYTFRIMVGLGFLFPLLTIAGYFLRNKLEANRWYLWIMALAIPLPWIAAELGWIVTEVGRQPWIVYGLMRTSDAASNIHVSQVSISLTAFIVVYSLLGLAAFALIAKTIKNGPEEALPKETGTGGVRS